MKQTFSLNSNFSLTHNDDGSSKLEGFAIHGGDDFIVNGIFEVPESEMQNCARSLKGAKLMKDHDTWHVDSIIGRVNKAKKQFDDREDVQMMGVKYDASLVVDDTSLAKKIEEGLIDATSIGFSFEPECSICGNPYFSEECEHSLWWDDMHLICRDMECHELSLVTFGADPHASVTGSLDAQSIEELKEKFSKQKEEFIMAKEDNTVETLKSENLELSQKVSDLEAKLEQQEADFEAEKDKMTVEHTDKVLTLQEEKQALEKQVESMTEELSAFRAEAEAKVAKALQEKTDRLTELAKKYDSEHVLKEKMTEEYMDDLIIVFEKREEAEAEKENVVPHFTSGKQPHASNNGEEKEHVAFDSVKQWFSGVNHTKGD